MPIDPETRIILRSAVTYIKDDRYLASLYRVPIRAVQRIRAVAETPEAPRTHKSTSKLARGAGKKINEPTEEGWYEMNVHGSAKLLTALLNHYHARAAEWNCDWAEAGAWLNGSMKGVRPGL